MSTTAILVAVTSFTVCPRITMLTLAYAGEMGVRMFTWSVNRVIFGAPQVPVTAATIRNILREELDKG
jgi:hypothetical protein